MGGNWVNGYGWVCLRIFIGKRNQDFVCLILNQEY